jgi:replicative DNA helicase
MPSISPFEAGTRVSANHAVEQALLGWFLRDSQLIAIAAAEVSALDFEDPFHQILAETMIDFAASDRVVSVMSIDAALRHLEEYTPDVGQQYLRDLSLAAPAMAGIPAADRRDLLSACRLLGEMSTRRRAIEVSEKAVLALRDGADTAKTLAGPAAIRDEILRAAQTRERGDAMVKTAVEKLFKDVEARASGRIDSGVRTGLNRLDGVLGGMYPGDFILIGGRPGMGKSILGDNLALAIARSGQYRPILFSAEMADIENVARMISEMDYEKALAEGRKPLTYTKILRGRLEDAQWSEFVRLGQDLAELDMMIVDEPKITISKIAALCRAAAAASGRKIVPIIDHLQIVSPEQRIPGKRVDELREISGDLKALAKQLEAPVIALSQLNRGLEAREDKRPGLSDLRESGTLEQDADVIIFLYREAYYLRAQIKHARAKGDGEGANRLERQLLEVENKLEADIAKNRNGPTTSIELFIDVASSIILDEAPQTFPAAQGLLLQ